MKAIYKITALALLAVAGCNLDYFPDNAITLAQVKSSEEGATDATLGNYAMFKDIQMFRNNNTETKNTYLRHYFHSTEFKGDNITINGSTPDHLYPCMIYQQTPDNTLTSYVWFVGYKIAIGTSNVIDAIKDGTSAEMDNLKGENYFLRALVHLQLATLFARPISEGADNPGIVIRNSTSTATTTRATVGEVYAAIISDLKNAARLMTLNKGGAYASKAAAYGLLSRVYLYMEKYPEAIQAANDCTSLCPESNLDADYASYYTRATSSKETLFAVAQASTDDKGQGSIASMYLKDGPGWGEVLASLPLRRLLARFPGDVRTKFIRPDFKGDSVLPTTNNGAAMFHYFYTDPTAGPGGAPQMMSGLATMYYYNGDFYTAQNGGGSKATTGTEPYSPILGLSATCTVDGTPREGYLIPEMNARTGGTYNNLPSYYLLKFSYQDANPMLSSPVFLRLAEVILNRAEAKLQSGGDPATDLHYIRARAGIPDATTITLDTLLDERNRELYLEGHRAYDLVRNGKSIDRRYPGAIPAVVVAPTDPRTIYYIPTMETEVSHIPQNP